MSDFKISEEFLGGKRKGTFSTHEAAMMTAIAWSLKSKDPSTQVGACITDTEDRVLTTGYNGTPRRTYPAPCCRPAWSDKARRTRRA